MQTVTRLLLVLSMIPWPAAAGGGPGQADAAGPERNKSGDWCEWLRDDPGRLHEDEDNPWLQWLEFGVRFDYQVARVEGSDVNDRDFNDTYDEYRRFRPRVSAGFLRYFETELEVNMVADDRFRNTIRRELRWGYDRFHEATIEFDAGEAFGSGFLDGIKLAYGRMKLRMGAEVHQSSRVIYTIERSAISEKLSGEFSRPTGLTVELDKADWELVLGVFSADDDSEFLGAWNDGRFYYAGIEWEPTDELTFLLDYSQNDRSGRNDALGLAWAGVLSVIYEDDRWGVIAEGIYGDNGGGISAPLPRRQGDFHAFLVMPWYWVVEDRLQVVLQYQYAESEESQGLQLPSRYIRGHHEDPAVDVDNGRGHRHHSIYAGVNYHFCRDRLKLMGGISYDRLSARRGNEVDALTYLAALRMAF